MAVGATSKTKKRKPVKAASKKPSSEGNLPVSQPRQREIKAEWGYYNVIGSLGYNGEKNPGEIGPIRDYTMNYNALRARSWQLLVESDVAQMIMKKYVEWVIGEGLKIQAEPVMDILESNGIRFDKQEWTRLVESRFRLFCNSRMSDWADMKPLSILEQEAFRSTSAGGDMLVVLKYDQDDRCVKVQLIDGAHVQSPSGVNIFPIQLDNGNRIYHGVEVDSRGRHVAYHVLKPGQNGILMPETQRIPARGTQTNALMAFMVYDSVYRVDSYRGMPLLSVVLETSKKLERYKEATVGGAEERQKIAYFFEHGINSTGEHPLTDATAIARDFDLVSQEGKRLVPIDDYGNDLANRVAATTGKETFNMPQDSTVKALSESQEISFKDFYEANLKVLCAAVGIPYEIAISVYGNNYSASRAAIKQWEHTITVKRANFAKQFMQPIYDFWLETEILTQKISAPGYLRALLYLDDRLVLEAFRNSRFVGPAVPHIDPEKEVKAERLRLGSAAEALPLTTLEDATEAVGRGDADSNVEQFAEEKDKAEGLGIKPPEPPKPSGGGKPKGAAK